MLECTRSSLTACGPTCLISILETRREVCARATGTKARIKKSPQSRKRNFIEFSLARLSFLISLFSFQFSKKSVWHVVVAYFGRTLKSRIGLQKGQVHIARRPVALLGDQQI